VSIDNYLYLAANLFLFANVLLAWSSHLRPRIAEARLRRILLALYVGTQAAGLAYSAAIGGLGAIAYSRSIAMIAVGVSALGLLLFDRSPDGKIPPAIALTLAFGLHSCAFLRASAPDTVPSGGWPFLNIWFVLHLVGAAAALGAYLLAAGASITWIITAVSARLAPDRNGRYQAPVTDLRGSALRIAFPLLTMSIFARSLWSYLGWGIYWSWDAKGAGLLALWLLLTSALHLPLRSRWHDPVRVLLVLVGLLVGMVTVPALGESLTAGV
jgi:ABC-type transport system involved in cytochrome c biogenesis permease subunit